jgi:hypothetical protein
MKKVTIIISIAIAAMMTGCSNSSKPISDEERSDISWNAFCDAYGYDRNTGSSIAISEYLDTWCGSVDEEAAFIVAGVEPY